MTGAIKRAQAGVPNSTTLTAFFRVLAQRGSNFLEIFYKVNRICTSQRFRSIFHETFYKHLISAVSDETKRLLCLVAQV